MEVLVAGATGVLGRRLVERLDDRDHDVTGLVRDDEGANTVESRGGTAYRGDVLDPKSLADAPDADVLVHAATSLPTEQKPPESAWERNDRVRREGAENLVEAMGERVDRVLFPSVVWVARQPDGSRFDETASRHPTRTTQSVADVEDYLEDASREYGFDAAVLRCGMFYAPDGAYTRLFARGILEDEMAVIGSGLLGRQDATLSLLHADDAALAFADAIDADATGRYHVVDDDPVTFAEYLGALAAELDAETPRRVPGWLARWLVGPESVDLFTNSFATTNERFNEDVGWEPRFPSYRDGVPAIVEAWEDDGTIRETEDGYAWVGD